MNTFMDALTSTTNYTLTENGAVTHKSTKSAVLDMFALGGAYRTRSNDDVLNLFLNAYQENATLALRCLFYLRDVRGGQGERRFFRVVLADLARRDPAAVRRNLKLIPEFGRWDDIYALEGTPLEKDAFDLLFDQLMLDYSCKTPSLLAKWLKSENTSSHESRRLGRKTREAFSKRCGGMSPKQYRLMLSALRSRINVLEKLMSAGRWDEIEFDKIPSKAGMKYRNAFARHDVERAMAGAQTFSSFVTDKSTKVNAATLTPGDVAANAFKCSTNDSTQRAAIDKFWENLTDFYRGREENGLAIVDTSGSMSWTNLPVQPLHAAVGMGAYIAERGKGPFQNHFITFSSTPQLVKFTGVDIVDKFRRASNADWGGSTNIEAVFALLLNTAKKEHVKPSDMPKTLYIFSDMEFDGCVCGDTWRYANNYGSWRSFTLKRDGIETLLESIAQHWKKEGYELPRVIFWNLNARQDNIPAIGGRFSYVSGYSMNMVETILSGKDGYDLMLEKLNSERYAAIH